MNSRNPESPPWLTSVLDSTLPAEGGEITLRERPFQMRQGILRDISLISDAQQQTTETFGFKWKLRDTFESDASRQRMRNWLIERYGNVEEATWWEEYGEFPLVVDAGCGASLSGIELLGGIMHRIHYLGVDISEAVDVAAERFRELGFEGVFLQADISNLPLPDESVDVIFSEGVLHHTDSTENALKSLARRLRPGGRLMFYVYRKKGPVREFTDDFVRERMQEMGPEEGWAAMMPLTKLGKVLGELDIDVDIPEEIGLLDIPAGRIKLQRLFYWHVFKAFYSPDLTLDEMNHINFDWYAPANAHRQTPEEVRTWCDEAGMEIEREVIEEAGITIIARKMEHD